MTVIKDCIPEAYTQHQLFQLCIDNGVFRLINFIETENNIELIICGVFKFSRNLKTGKVTQWIRQLNQEWKRTTSLPVNIYAFRKQSDQWKASQWINEACRHIVAQATTTQGKFIYVDGIALAPNARKKTYSGRFRVSEITVQKIISRSIHFIDLKAKEGAVILSRKYFWRFIDKAYFSQYLKSHRFFSSVRETDLQGYLSFIRSTRIDPEVDIGSLWPLIGAMLMSRKYYSEIGSKKNIISIDGTNKSVHNAFKQHLGYINLSVGDMKAFRKMAPTFVDIFSQLLKKHMVEIKGCRDGYVRNETVKNTESKITLTKAFLRLNVLKKYPVTVVRDIFNNLIIANYMHLDFRHQGFNFNSAFFIIQKWFEYNQDLYKNIGYKNQRHRWSREKNELYHVIDWYLFNHDTLEINKKYKWETMWRNAREWGLNQKYYEDNTPEEWDGTKIDWASIMPNVVEITKKADLYDEGKRMQHCVYSYRSECASGDYIVFSLKHEEEEATLGCCRIHNDKRYKLQQVRGIDNAPVSNSMEKKAKSVVRMLNKLL